MESVTTPRTAQPIVGLPTYAPSWVDRLNTFTDRLPGPPLLYQFGLWLLLIGIDLVLRNQGATELQLPRPFVFVFLIAFPYNTWLMHYLDRMAGKALQRFRPGLECDDDSYDTLCYHLTTLPAQPTLLVLVVGVLFSLIVVDSIPIEQRLAFVEVNAVGPLYYYHSLMAVVAFVAAATIIYHTWHQLRIVNYIYRNYTIVNLFEQQPLYAFSNLSAQTAVGILFISYGWTIAAPELFNIAITSIWLPIFNIICALTFVYPLIGIHNLLKADKEARLVQVSHRQRIAEEELHRRVDAHAMVDMDNLNKAMQALETEYQAIKRAPTWPWHPEAPRAVAAALLFPILLWLMQRILERSLGS
ncbi:MAG: hypothetical protein IT320_27305 [Anaerolineae bacterium]|nr:hypothetical protein [Anaerolineae bacterium]